MHAHTTIAFPLENLDSMQIKLPKRRFFALLVPAVAVFFAIFGQSARGDEISLFSQEIPLYKQEPFDLITLNKANDNKVLKVVPIGLSPREIAGKMKSPRNKKLEVRLFESRDKLYAVLWREVEKVETFDELLLRKAKELYQGEDKQFDDAYDYYLFMYSDRPNAPGLNKAFDDFLWAEAIDAFVGKKFDNALALLKELHRRTPDRQKLDRALGRTIDQLAGGYVDKKDYASARILLRFLRSAYPDNQVIKDWTERLKGKASPLLDEARAAAEADQADKATSAMRRVADIYPDLAGARELALSIHRKFPRVVVGVTSLATDFKPGRLNDWNSRRDSRLIYRTLAEFAGPSAEGGNYFCPVGEIISEELGQRMVIKLKPNIHWATGKETLDNSDVARILLDRALPGKPNYRLDWADLADSIALRGVYGVDVQLRRPHVRPEAMLQIVLTPQSYSPSSGEPPPANGPFVVKSHGDDATVFTANQQYFSAAPGRPTEIVERRFEKVSFAIQALKQGDIDVLDRVNPWQLPVLRDNDEFKVEPYALPLIHCLVPNLDKPLLDNRNFRRALVYGINREVIVEQMLAGVEIPGCVVTSSPFPLSIGPNDPMGYASDDGVEPRPYDPRLSIALSNVAYTMFIDKRDGKKSEAAKEGEKQAKATGMEKIPPLVLAHPDDEIARGACKSIKLQLKIAGITVNLREIKGPMPERIPDDVDLMYVELATWEPVVDARRLLGEDGMGGRCSPYMSQALRELDEAVEWGKVRSCLHQVHRIAHSDVTIIPLWQVVEHFAYRERAVRGILASPVSLYQNIEQWRPAFKYPSEEK